MTSPGCRGFVCNPCPHSSEEAVLSTRSSVVPIAGRSRRRAVRPHHRTVHGYRRAFVMGGSGPALLFIHGIGDSSETWRNILPELAKDHTVIAPDLLGHGASDKPRADYSIAAYACGMRDLLAILDVERVTVIGHSLGGGVAMQFAYQFPERCGRLVLVSTGGVGRDVALGVRAVSAPGADLILPLLTPLAELAPVKWSLQLFGSLLRLAGAALGEDADDLLAGYRRLSDPAARSAFLRTLRAVVDPGGQVVTMLDRSYLAEHMPIMLVCGKRDPIIPFRHSEVAHAAMPGSRLVVFPGAGHFPHHHDPARFVEVLRAFLADTTPSQYDPAVWRELLRAGRRSPDLNSAAGREQHKMARSQKPGAT
jgi:pimeloyl-ACP methyl ester carboxylesterase